MVVDRDRELIQLRSQVATLEELLVVYEQAALEQSNRLEQALAVVRERAQELERARDTLRALQTILDSLGEAALVVDRAGVPILVNPIAERILGVRVGDPTMPSLYGADGQTPYASDALPWRKATRGAAIDGEICCLLQGAAAGSSDRNHCWLHVTARPLCDLTQCITGGVAVCRDITQQRHEMAAWEGERQQMSGQIRQMEATLAALGSLPVALSPNPITLSANPDP